MESIIFRFQPLGGKMTSPFVWLESRCRYTCFILFYVYYMSCVHMCVCVCVCFVCICMHDEYVYSVICLIFQYMVYYWMLYACYGYAYILPGRHTSQATCGLRRKSIPSTTSVTVSLGKFGGFGSSELPSRETITYPTWGEGKTSLKGL